MQRGFLIFLPFRLLSFPIFQQKLRNISFVAQFAGERRQGADPSGHGIHKGSRDEGSPHRTAAQNPRQQQRKTPTRPAARYRPPKYRIKISLI